MGGRGASPLWLTPACWHVIWTVLPTSPVTPGPSITWRTRVERSSRERITYWISITNQTDQAVEIDGRYEIVARV